MLFELISHTVNLLLHNFYQPKVHWLSRYIGYISVQALHFRLASCEGAGLDCWIFFSYHSAIPEKFVTARVDFGIAFSIKIISSSALFGFGKALEQDAMSSSISRRKVQNTCEI